MKKILLHLKPHYFEMGFQKIPGYIKPDEQINIQILFCYAKSIFPSDISNLFCLPDFDHSWTVEFHYNWFLLFLHHQMEWSMCCETMNLQSFAVVGVYCHTWPKGCLHIQGENNYYSKKILRFLHIQWKCVGQEESKWKSVVRLSLKHWERPWWRMDLRTEIQGLG